VKKIFFIVTALSLFFILGLKGCSEQNDAAETTPKFQIANEVAQEIMDCFINKDEEALYSLLSPSAREYEHTSEQIKEAFDLIDGEIISYGLPIDIGKTTSENMSPCIENIKTDSGEKYSIEFQYSFAADENTGEWQGVCLIFVSWIDENSNVGDFFERIEIGRDPNE